MQTKRFRKINEKTVPNIVVYRAYSQLNKHVLASGNMTNNLRLLAITLGPFIRGKIRRELDHLYEHVLSKSSVYLNLLLKCKFIIRR